MKDRIKKNFKLFLDNAYNMFALSILTGLFAGVVITFYNILAHIGEEKSAALYALLLENPAFIPLLFVGLAAGAVVIGTAVRFVPMIRGSGIPQIEGASRGIIRFKWYVAMCSMFAASLACIFMGYPAGAEGPSVKMGGCAGYGVATILKRNQMQRRLQTASGASAGLAVAFNAPVTGLVFALEEAFRSFSPQVFICSAVSVITAVCTRNAIRPALNLSVGFAFNTFEFNFAFDAGGAMFCLWTALAALAVSLVGVGFYHLVFLFKKLLGRIRFFHGTVKFIIPFLIAGAFGLITVYSLGGGHSFIEALGSKGSLQSVFGAGVIVSVLVVVVIRLITTALSMGCGVPCGVFIPMLAIGAGVGAIFSVLFEQAGMDAQYRDYLIIISMAAFFTCVVKAPVTGIVMVFELTGNFANFLPALIGIAIGYIVGRIFRTEPIYEKSLKNYIEEEKLYKKFEKVSVRVTVCEGSPADGAQVRTIIWPTNGLVVSCTAADGEVTVPDGETILHAGDEIEFECETDDKDELMKYLYSIAGEPPVKN